jgi:hypothetical protein
MRAETEIVVSFQNVTAPVPMILEGDFQPPGKARMVFSMESFGETTKFEMIAIGDELYVRDLDGGEWSNEGGESFLPLMFLGNFSLADANDVRNLEYVGLETLDGESVYHLKGVLPAAAHGLEVEGDFTFDFWIDIGLRLRKQTVEAELRDPGELFGLPDDIEEVAMNMTQTAWYSSYGEVVTILAPEEFAAPEVAAGYVLGEILLEEDFSQADSWGRSEDSSSVSSLEAVGGFYRIQSQTGESWWGLNEQEHADVVIEVTASQRSAGRSAYGLMCRADASNDGSGYWFLIGDEGFSAIHRVGGLGGFSPLAGYPSSAVKLGQASNIIRAVCIGDYLALYVNGEFVMEARDSSFARGYAGLAAISPVDTPIDAIFDDLTIWEASLP